MASGGLKTAKLNRGMSGVGTSSMEAAESTVSKSSVSSNFGRSVSVGSAGGEGRRSMYRKATSRSLVAKMQEDIAKAQSLRLASKEDNSFTAGDSGTFSFQHLITKGEESDIVGENAMSTAMSKKTIDQQVKSAIAATEARGKVGVCRRHMLAAIAEDDHQVKTCVKLPLTLFYSCVFILFYQAHYNTSALYVQEAAIRASMGSAPAEAETAEDIYRWMDGALFPYLWSLPNPADNATMLARNMLPQTLVGGVRIHTARGPDEADCDEKGDLPGRLPCTPNSPRIAPAPAAPALNGWRVTRRLAASGLPRAQSRLTEGAPAPRKRRAAAAAAAADRGAAARRLKQLNYAWLGDPVNAGLSSGFYTKVVPKGASMAEVRAMIDGFKNASMPLVDQSTLFLTVEFALRNGELSTGVLSVATVTFMFSRAGGIYSISSINSLASNLKFRALGMLALWVVLLMYLTGVTSLSALVAARHHAFKSTFFNVSSAIDALVILGGWVLVACMVVETMGMMTFESDYEAYGLERAAADPASWQDVDRKWLDIIMVDTQSARSIAQDSITVVAGYTILLVMRFLVATMGHPRLALVVRTLSGSFSDLLHLMFIFMVVFMAYVMSGRILFGRRMEELSTVGGAFGYCLQIVFQREFQLAEITAEEATVGTLWVTTFVFCLCLVAVNLVLTMIFNQYGDLRESVNKQDTVFQYGLHFLRKLKHQSVWLSNREILQGLVTLPVGKPLSPAEVMTAVPGLSKAQFNEIWPKAKRIAGKGHSKQINANIVTFISSVLHEVANLQRGVRQMARVGGSEVSAAGVAKEKTTKEGNMEEIASEKIDDIRASTEANHQVDIFDEDAIPGLLPGEEPAWVKGALGRHLQIQTELMKAMSAQIEAAKCKMAPRMGETMPSPPWASAAPTLQAAKSAPSKELKTTKAARVPRQTVQPARTEAAVERPAEAEQAIERPGEEEMAI